MNTTLIGSMPYKEAEIALEKIIENIKIPCWPQLPKRSFKEHMCVQYSENFPGIKIDDVNNKVYLNEEIFYQEIENFYQNYIDKNYNFFKISEDYACGFYKFLDVIPNISNNNLETILKLQTTGPITFGFSIKNSSNRAIFYDLQLREILIKHLTMKSLWQIKEILRNINCSKNKKIKLILFYDEPYLAAYGSAFTSVSKEELISCLSSILKETKELFLEIKNNNSNISLEIGIHCCANTDWSILTETENLDIISFDAYEFFRHFVLYIEEIKKFINKNGNIAWGIVPNSEKIFSVSVDELTDRLKVSVEDLILKGIDKKLIFKNLIITPQCGLGNVKEDIAVKVLEICKLLSYKEI